MLASHHGRHGSSGMRAALVEPRTPDTTEGRHGGDAAARMHACSIRASLHTAPNWELECYTNRLHCRTSAMYCRCTQYLVPDQYHTLKCPPVPVQVQCRTSALYSRTSVTEKGRSGAPQRALLLMLLSFRICFSNINFGKHALSTQYQTRASESPIRSACLVPFWSKRSPFGLIPMGW